MPEGDPAANQELMRIRGEQLVDVLELAEAIMAGRRQMGVEYTRKPLEFPPLSSVQTTDEPETGTL